MAVKAIEGKGKVLMFRALEDATLKDALRLALQTSHEFSLEPNSDSTSTKDGNMTSTGTTETSLSFDALLSMNDKEDEDVLAILKKAVKESKKIEVWEVNFSAGKTSTGKYKATYSQGSLSSWSESNDVDGYATVSGEVAIDGIPQDGEVTLSTEQETAIQYAFRDLQKLTEPESGE